MSKVSADAFLSGTVPEPNVSIAVPLVDSNHYDAVNAMIPKIFESFKLSDIQSLHIQRFISNSRWPTVVGIFQQTFSQAPQLQTLVVSDWMTETLPKLLLSPKGSPVFPVLEVFGLKAAQWPEDDQAMPLSDVLKVYRGKGAKVTRVLVRDSLAADERDVEEAKGAIENFDWDGVSGPAIDEEEDRENFSDDED